VTVADGGEAGICALEASTFDVMLVDIFMPHMRGFESIRVRPPANSPKGPYGALGSATPRTGRFGDGRPQAPSTLLWFRTRLVLLLHESLGPGHA
jgi:hypothetical protein